MEFIERYFAYGDEYIKETFKNIAACFQNEQEDSIMLNCVQDIVNAKQQDDGQLIEIEISLSEDCEEMVLSSNDEKAFLIVSGIIQNAFIKETKDAVISDNRMENPDIHSFIRFDNISPN